MGCGASVPKGEIDQELKQQKTKNDESQRQLDHMKELYARERERNKELRGQMKQNSQPGTPQSEPQEPANPAAPPAQPDPPADQATTEPEATAEDAAAEPTPTEDTETPEAAGGEPAPEQETEADANATEPDAEMSPSEPATATDAESTEPETTAADEPTAAEPTDATTEAAPESTEAGSAAAESAAPNADAGVVLNLNFIADAAEKAKLEAEKAEADAEVKRLEAALAEAASEAAAKVAALEAAVAEANAKTEAAEKAKTDAEEAKAAAETADETAKAAAADEVAKTQTALANILNAQEQAGARVAALETAVAEANAKTAEAQAAAQAQAAEAMRMMAQMAEMAARQQAAAAAVPVAAPAAVPVAAAATFGPYGPEHEASAVRIQTSARGKLARSASKRIREEVRGCPYGDMAVSEVWVPESTPASCIDPSNADVIAKHEPVWSRLRTNLHPHATKDAKSPLKPHGSKSLKLWSDAYTLAKCGAFELAIEAYWRFTHERMSELGHTRYGTIPPFFQHDHQDYLNSLYNVASLLEAQAVDPGPDPSAEEILHPEKVLKGDKHAQAYGLFSELVAMTDSMTDFWSDADGPLDAAERREALMALAADRGHMFTAKDLANHDTERAVMLSYRGKSSPKRDEAHAGGVLLSRHGKHKEAAEMFARAAEISLNDDDKKHMALYAINAQFGSLVRLGQVHSNADEDDAAVREIRDRFRRVMGEPDGVLGDAAAFANQGRHPGALSMLINEVLRFRRYEHTLKDPRKENAHGPSPWPVYTHDVAWCSYRIGREFEAMRWYPEALEQVDEALAMFEGMDGEGAAMTAKSVRRKRDELREKLARRDADFKEFQAHELRVGPSLDGASFVGKTKTEDPTPTAAAEPAVEPAVEPTAAVETPANSAADAAVAAAEAAQAAAQQAAAAAAQAYEIAAAAEATAEAAAEIAAAAADAKDGAEVPAEEEKVQE